MKKLLQIVSCLLLTASLCFGQTTILDYEDAATSSTFQFFGGALEGAMSATIANPNATGINTSAMVGEFKKAGDGPTWAGGFTSPPTALNLVGATEICIDVHMDAVREVRLKLEDSGTNGNWEQGKSNTVTGEWEQLCFDVTMADASPDANPAAVGHNYPKLVLFFGFGEEMPGAEQVSYFDNVIINAGAVEDKMVTFQLNMTDYTGDAGDVYIRGSFNGWSEDNVMTDMGSGLWETTITVPPGAIEYKFWVSSGGDGTWEDFSPLAECVLTTGGYTNRLYLVAEDATVSNAWNSCYEQGEEVQLTFELGTSHITVDPEGIWLAGGGNFDIPGGRYKMSDDDNDGIYTITMPRYKGFESFYIFTNGNCPDDWACKEQIEGLLCANSANYNDRYLAELTEDVTISTCFEQCNDVATSCTVGTHDVIAVEDLFQMTPTVVQDYALINLLQTGDADRNINVVSTYGAQILSTQLDKHLSNYKLDAGNLAAGVYFLQVQQGSLVQTTKFLVL